MSVVLGDTLKALGRAREDAGRSKPDWFVVSLTAAAVRKEGQGVMRTPAYRTIFDWPRFERDFREAARRRNWPAETIDAALRRDRLCTIDVDDLEAHLDWHEQLGFAMPRVVGGEG